MLMGMREQGPWPHAFIPQLVVGDVVSIRMHRLAQFRMQNSKPIPSGA